MYPLFCITSLIWMTYFQNHIWKWIILHSIIQSCVKRSRLLSEIRVSNIYLFIYTVDTPLVTQFWNYLCDTLFCGPKLVSVRKFCSQSKREFNVHLSKYWAIDYSQWRGKDIANLMKFMLNCVTKSLSHSRSDTFSLSDTNLKEVSTVVDVFTSANLIIQTHSSKNIDIQHKQFFSYHVFDSWLFVLVK